MGQKSALKMTVNKKCLNFKEIELYNMSNELKTWHTNFAGEKKNLGWMATHTHMLSIPILAPSACNHATPLEMVQRTKSKKCTHFTGGSNGQ